MTVTTRIHRAIDRVEAERERADETVTALERFARTLEQIEPVSPTRPTATDGGVTAISMAGAQSVSSESADRCRAVRDAFDETVRAVASRSARPPTLTEHVRDELGPELALALSPESDRRFTPDVKAAVRSTIGTRHSERTAMAAALADELESLRSAVDTVETITDWLVAADETPLLELGFEELRERHETLARHRERCRRVCRERQDVIHGTTTDGTVGVSHRRLVASLYSDCPRSYPVLATMCQLEALCERCQRSVRDHLTRRV
ncbi:hypothetical protein RBH26_07995 [Natronolimnohabitans sp. A-GB9]|uniref:DUF7260 family protein n=1 Tax=Natronolimnohabitans sp. A-GB9 TaxID=3069757 RepID=UPI0027B30385|nr:hypothetical protein [Natronolimnohabitans sp. A-GB9]MDQ2050427.1 hypothetical protein [Natronolimnohabitans sp. A-GB9]